MLHRQQTVLVIVWMTALLVVGWLVATGRQVALRRGQLANETLAALLEKQIARTFETIDITLAAIGDAHQLTPRPQKNDTDFRQMMVERLEDLPVVRALFIIGPGGWILHDTDYPDTPVVSLGDRPYFRAWQRGTPPEGISPPMQSRSGTGWFLPVTQPLSRSGAFEGVVVAAVQVDRFRKQFREIGLGDTSTMALSYIDGTLIARHPAANGEIGKRSDPFCLFYSHLPASSGTFWSDDGVHGTERVVSYRVVQGTPLVVQVSRSKGDVLAQWRRTATAAGVAMLTLTSVLAWFLVRMAREDARREYERQKFMRAERLEALGRLASGMAHDFANFLNIIAINLSLLRRWSSDSPETKDALDSMERAVRGGTLVTERLLACARKRPLKLAPVRLDRWLHDARALLANAAGSKMSVIIEAEQHVPAVLCDAGQLDIAIVNLVVNARDAMEGSGRVTLQVFPCVDNKAGVPKMVAGESPFVCLTVRDTGPGMSEEVRRRALEPFYTTKGEAGTGLGLSQVYGFMRQLGGNVTIDSIAGEGTAVHLFFPAAPPTRSDPQQAVRQASREQMPTEGARRG